MEDSLIQLTAFADSLKAGAKKIADIGPNELALAIAAVVSAVFAGVSAVSTAYNVYKTNLFHRQSKLDETKRAEQSYAALWGAVLAEISSALTRMRTQTEGWLNNKSLNRLEIILTPELRTSFLLASKHPAVSLRVMSLYDNIMHYKDAHTAAVLFKKRAGSVAIGLNGPMESELPALLSSVSEWMGTAAWIVQNRHVSLVDDFIFCRSEYEQFLATIGQPTDNLPIIPRVLAEGLRRCEGASEPLMPAETA